MLYTTSLTDWPSAPRSRCLFSMALAPLSLSSARNSLTSWVRVIKGFNNGFSVERALIQSSTTALWTLTFTECLWKKTCEAHLRSVSPCRRLHYPAERGVEHPTGCVLQPAVCHVLLCGPGSGHLVGKRFCPQHHLCLRWWHVPLHILGWYGKSSVG